MVKKAQQYYAFLETVEQIWHLTNYPKFFYYAVIKNVLTFSITVWFGHASDKEKAQLETHVKCASKIIELTLPTIESVYHTRCMRKSKNIVRDATYPANHFFELVQSGKRYRSVKAMTRFRRFLFGSYKIYYVRIRRAVYSSRYRRE